MMSQRVDIFDGTDRHGYARKVSKRIGSRAYVGDVDKLDHIFHQEVLARVCNVVNQYASVREWEVFWLSLALMRSGYPPGAIWIVSAKEVAHRMGISNGRVYQLIQALRRKIEQHCGDTWREQS